MGHREQTDKVKSKTNVAQEDEADSGFVLEDLKV